MSLRGTTTARHAKKIIINEAGGDRGERILCAWDDCDRDAVALHVVRVDHGSPGHPYRTTYAFCTERHRQFWLNGHRNYGNAR